MVGGQRFSFNEVAIAETEAYFLGFDKNYFLDGLRKLKHRWSKCIGDYVENENNKNI